MNPSVKRWFDRLRSRTAAFMHDLLMVPVAWLLAYWVRFNLQRIPPDYLGTAWHTLPIVMLVCGLVYWTFGLYRGVWRFASLPDLVRITKAVVAATVIVMLVLFIYNRGAHIPRSVPLLFLLFQLALLSGPRLLYRWLKDHRLALHAGVRVLIVGARGAGETLVREMRRDRAHTYDPVAFVDDTPRRQGGDIHGIPIKGTTAKIPELTKKSSHRPDHAGDAHRIRGRKCSAWCNSVSKPASHFAPCLSCRICSPDKSPSTSCARCRSRICSVALR